MLKILSKPQKILWTDAEIKKYEEGLNIYGKDWQELSRYIGTKDN